MKNYYELLQVDKNANLEVIKKVYKYHIKKNHPDLFKGIEKENAKKRVQEFNEAYEILSDEEKRKLYDEELKNSFDEKMGDVSDLDLIKRLKYENEILNEELMYKDRILKQLLNELNIPYSSVIQKSYENVTKESYNKNDNENINETNTYGDNVKIKIILALGLLILFIIVLSHVTGNNYLDFVGLNFFNKK